MITRIFRPYSIGLFALSIPTSYILFVFISIVALMLAERTYFSVADGLYYFSIVYAVSCYLWIPGTWLSLSFLGRFTNRRRARKHGNT